MTDRFDRTLNWRRNGIGVIAITEPKISFAPRSFWGKDMGGGTAIGREWVETGVITVPEGIVIGVSCRECGGRHETLVDFREAAKQDPTLADSYAILDHSEGRRLWESAKVSAALDAFASEHANCKVTPKVWRATDEIEEFYVRGTDEAKRQLSFGSVAPVAIYLSDAGHVFASPFPDIEQRTGNDKHDRERRIKIAVWHWSVREMLRARNLTPAAMAMYHEGWMTKLDKDDDSTYYPAKHPDREERFIASLITPEFVRIGAGDITRKTGKVDDGSPGTVGELHFSPGPWGQGMIDGALATTKASWVPDPFNSTGIEL